MLMQCCAASSVYTENTGSTKPSHVVKNEQFHIQVRYRPTHIKEFYLYFPAYCCLRAYPSNITVYESNAYSHEEIKEICLLHAIARECDLEDSEDTNKVCED